MIVGNTLQVRGTSFSVIRNVLQQKIQVALAKLQDGGVISRADYPVPDIAEPKQPEHGDYACNIAMTSAKLSGQNPRAFGEALATVLSSDPDFLAVEVAGPGFLNFRLNPAFAASFLSDVIREGESFGKSKSENPLRINVEFVSVNPNGPITIGSGRGAAYGSTLCNVLEAAGNTVHREYYINDGVNSEQMRLFAVSVKALAEGHPVPENGYKGDYVQAVADQIAVDNPGLAAADKPVEWYQIESQRLMLKAQKEALTAFGVEFDTWFSEQSLHDGGQVAKEFETLLKGGVADELPIRKVLKLAKGGKIEDVQEETQASEEGEGSTSTAWLRSTKFGDDMDRVLRRRDGRLTYIASDVAYHWDKFTRPADADKLITVLGPDHHGYIGRLLAVVGALLLAEGKVQDPTPGGELSEIEAKLYFSPQDRDRSLAALALARQKLEVQIFQLVRFMKDGAPAPMRKRDGNIYALIDLIREIGQKLRPDEAPEIQNETGRDVARFFYLMRSHDTTFDFDLNLAETKSDENPVFYVQYAHARICSILEKAGDQSGEVKLELLQNPKEVALIRQICDLPYQIQRCAEDYGVHRLVNYAIELARSFHHFYGECRVIQEEEPELTKARLTLCRAAQVALQSALKMLGVSAPTKM